MCLEANQQCICRQSQKMIINQFSAISLAQSDNCLFGRNSEHFNTTMTSAQQKYFRRIKVCITFYVNILGIDTFGQNYWFVLT